MKKFIAILFTLALLGYFSTSCNKEKDTTPPEITMLGDTIIWQEPGKPYVDPGATAWDEEDGDITNNIVTHSDVNVDVPAYNYHVTYNVEDAAGNRADEVVRTVHVQYQ